ncbi:MAG: single-stranded DNA-binding protein [Phycisphaeraceae bacterium]|nr:single-stranded DNA-binding protein [Phycisphaeraceae bacterium]MCW5763133.1 single-stranded DNA-binding protein [Phycisphaeraceae bacterium]
MAASLNKVILIGNLTRDIELKHTASNMAVANFGLAMNRRFRAGDGQMRDEVTFVDCEAWGKTAESMSKYLHKGRPVFVEGRLKLDTWEDKNDGSKKSRIRVVVENFQFVDSKGSDGGNEGSSGGGSYASTRSSSGNQDHSDHGSDDDIPF